MPSCSYHRGQQRRAPDPRIANKPVNEAMMAAALKWRQRRQVVTHALEKQVKLASECKALLLG